MQLPLQVLGMLGSVAGKRVVEVGAGIGRFTGELARNASHVVAVDFMENLIEQNRISNAHCSNVEWLQADATQLQVLQRFYCSTAGRVIYLDT